MKRVAVALGIALALGAGLAGCSAAPERAGPYDLGPEALSRIGPESDADDVRAALGPPFSLTELGGGRELWSYRYRTERADGGVRHRSVARGERVVPSGTLYLIFLSNGRLGRYYLSPR